jgi:hypothetical protein
MTVSFNYQSRQINYQDWLDLITLCLTPLAAHIIAGVPSPSLLQPKKPRWHDRLGLFNPTTILWRYFVISDRRLRARSWNRVIMAASNAMFWTTKGWDGSEGMIRASVAYCERMPSKTYIKILSGTAAKTLIIGVQGLTAVYTLLMGVIHPNHDKYANLVSVRYIFTPLTIFGLLRLPIAFWLSEDYSFGNSKTLNDQSIEMERVIMTPKRPDHARTISTVALLEGDCPSPPREIEEESFHPTNSWRGYLTRAVFLGILISFWGITLFYMTPYNGLIFTATNLFLNLFYLIWLSATIVITGLYILRGKSTTTILPCVSTTWYKLYTGFLIILIVGITVLSALETRKTSCGKYTTYPPSHDAELCATPPP